MASNLESEIKSLFAALLRLNFQNYLISEEFKLILMENDIDQIWDRCLRINRSNSKVSVLVPQYSGDAREIFPNFLYVICTQKDSEFEQILFEILKDFQTWSKKDLDFSQIYKRLRYMDYEIPEIPKYLESTQDKNYSQTNVNKCEILSAELNNNKVFIVHGHDETLKLEVERTLGQLGLEPIILHRKPDQGQTTIEKFELYSDLCKFAIILLTPDDIGKKANGEEELKTRARQNVIFEMGYFFGKLNRRRVLVLNDGIEDLPSDYIGILYKRVDSTKRWKVDVITALRDAGYEFSSDQMANAIR